jgi:hypothetical protein
LKREVSCLRKALRHIRVSDLALPVAPAQRDFFFAFLPCFAFAFGGGTLPPSRLASDSPIAIACFLLFTFFPDPPLRKVPSLRSCMARFTFCDALAPYFLLAISASPA